MENKEENRYWQFIEVEFMDGRKASFGGSAVMWENDENVKIKKVTFLEPFLIPPKVSVEEFAFCEMQCKIRLGIEYNENKEIK